MSKWNKPLPFDVEQTSRCVHQNILKSYTQNLEKRETSLKKLALKLLSVDNQNEMSSTFFKKRHVFFRRGQKKRIAVPKDNKRALSNSKKRELGLFSLPQNTLTYREALPIHSMWLEYIKSFLNTKSLKPNIEQRVKFFKADYIGADIKIVRSKCPSLVGQEGIVIFETKFTFKIITKDDITKTIPKCSCVFKIKVDEVTLTIFGNYFAIRPAERINKKHKTRTLFDL